MSIIKTLVYVNQLILSAATLILGIGLRIFWSAHVEHVFNGRRLGGGVDMFMNIICVHVVSVFLRVISTSPPSHHSFSYLLSFLIRLIISL